MLLILPCQYVHVEYYVPFLCIAVIFIQKQTGGQKFIWKLNPDGFVCNLTSSFQFWLNFRPHHSTSQYYVCTCGLLLQSDCLSVCL